MSETREIVRRAEKIAADVRLDAERVRAKLEGPKDREATCFQTGRIDAAEKIERSIFMLLDAPPPASQPQASAREAAERAVIEAAKWETDAEQADFGPEGATDATIRAKLAKIHAAYNLRARAVDALKALEQK